MKTDLKITLYEIASYTKQRDARLLRLAAQRIAVLEDFVREQPCECTDEYHKPRPKPCDRCRLLGEDNRELTA
jgi:hypothetical protein